MTADDVLTTGRRRLAINKVGEAMASASVARKGPGAGAALVLLLACTACGDDPTLPVVTDVIDASPAMTNGDAGVPGTPVARMYWQAYLEAQLGGDVEVARRGFEEVLALAADDPVAAARAAVELAGLEALAGNRRRALELLARAQSLAPDDPTVADAAGSLSARLAATPAGQSDVRGPAPRTALPGVTPAVAAAWRSAEQLLVTAHRIRMKPVLEALSGSVRSKENATESAARAYREIAEVGGVAAVAAEFRIGTLYHDLAVELVFDLPPELDASVANRLRRTLRASAVAYLRRAVAAYERALAIGVTGPWRVASEASVRAAKELLAGAAR